MKANARKPKRQRRERFTIVEFVNPSGEKVFRVQGYKASGERVRANFTTMAEAAAEKQRLDLEAENEKIEFSLRSTRLTDEQVKDAEWAFRELGSKSLRQAVRFFLDNYRESRTAMPLADALREFIAEKQNANLRPHTIRNLRVRVSHLVAGNERRLVSDLMVEDVQGVIERPGLTPRSKSNERRAIGTFFAWATKRGYCPANPVAKIDAPKVDAPEPVVLSLAEARRLLAAAQAYKDGVLVPYIALSLFAGLRPTELARLSWEDVDLETGTVTIGARMAKMRQRRIVEMARLAKAKSKEPDEPNLLDWLRPYAIRHQPFVGPNFQKTFDAVKEAAGFGTPTEENPNLRAWPVDCMRHTALSMHLALSKHEGTTASWAGNSPDVLHRHYRGLVKEADAREFWSIRPAAEATILAMPKTAAVG